MGVLYRWLLVRRPHRQHSPDGRERRPLGTTEVEDGLWNPMCVLFPPHGNGDGDGGD